MKFQNLLQSNLADGACSTEFLVMLTLMLLFDLSREMTVNSGTVKMLELIQEIVGFGFLATASMSSALSDIRLV